MTSIENEFLKVSIKQKGAELASIHNKASGLEQLWQGDPAIWAWHAPNLFPIVGGVINNELLAEAGTFKLNRHGFARHSDFILVDHGETHALFSLPYSNNTLNVYPYKFDFQILYTLIDNALRIIYKVINLDNKTIHFSVGGHPAFNVPFYPGEKYEDYYLEFENEDQLTTHLISSKGFFTGETAPIILDGGKLRLTADLFNNDALVFKHVKSKMITIKSENHAQSLSVEFPHFEHLGIWSKAGAPFVCIEPWLGYTDTEGKPTDISQKEAIHHLKHGHTFEAAYFISI
ncbi:aldose 1-epimerase family protein [Mucilaginibacter hurinus]|uniref:Aldose 1-epimerase family protein n=1 Tax=Mucilaginibacter hurinus TaxID=2201324 RepID=A0A367GNI7_9SPHI|nr:aldose 1-epimerase family protein [Mucilaginibacter hurinus]RCH54253.1 aldose 1-epimerase family protein [Mucilaginibacter hurinus]